MVHPKPWQASCSPTPGHPHRPLRRLPVKTLGPQGDPRSRTVPLRAQVHISTGFIEKEEVMAENPYDLDVSIVETSDAAALMCSTDNGCNTQAGSDC